MTRVYEAELKAAGINPAQFELLGNLAGRPGSSQGELARRMDVDQTTLSRNLKLLVAADWVAGEPAAGDRRRIEYRLTGKGSAALRGAMPHWERATARMHAALGGDAAQVRAALERLGTAV